MKRAVVTKDAHQRLIILVALAVMIVSGLLYAYFNPALWQEEAVLDHGEQGAQGKSDSELPPPDSDGSKPAFDIVRISRGGTGIIAGRMTPGAEIDLKANGEVIASVTADENGEWVILLDEPLEAGSVEFSLSGSEKGTLDRVEADDVVVVSVPERDDDRLLERAENDVVAVLSPKDGVGASKVLQRPGGQAPAEIGDSLSVITVDYGDRAGTVVTGTGVPRFDVRLYLDESFVGIARVEDDGSWQIPFDKKLEKTSYVLRADQTIGDGTVELRIEQPFETGFDIDASKAASGVVVQPGNTLWHIARQLYGTGFRYTVIFRQNSEQIKDPNLIYPGQLFELPQNTGTVPSKAGSNG